MNEEADDLEADDAPDAETFLIGQIVKDAIRSEPGVIDLCFADDTTLHIYNAVTLRGDRGEGLLALRRATLQSLEFSSAAILLSFDNGASIRVGLAEEDCQDSAAKTCDEDAMEYHRDGIGTYLWCSGEACLSADESERIPSTPAAAAEALLLGRMIENAEEADGLVNLHFFDDSMLTIYVPMTFSGDGGDGLRALRGASVSCIALADDAVTFTCDNTATVRLDLGHRHHLTPPECDEDFFGTSHDVMEFKRRGRSVCLWSFPFDVDGRKEPPQLALY